MVTYADQWDSSFTKALKDDAANSVPPEALIREVSYWLRNQENKGVLCALDAGCGVGVMTRWLVRKGFHVNGVDISEVALDRCKELDAQQFTLEEQRRSWHYRSSLTNLPYVNNVFHLVVEANVIQHMTRPDRTKAFQEIYRVLAPGGIFIAQQQGNETSLRRKDAVPVEGDSNTFTFPKGGNGYSLSDFPTHFFQDWEYDPAAGFPPFSSIDAHSLLYDLPKAEAIRRGFPDGYMNHFYMLNCVK